MKCDDLESTLQLFDGLDAYIDVLDGNLEDGLFMFECAEDFDPATSPMIDFLGQDVWWRPNGEPPIPIDDMDSSHIHNLMWFLDRNAVGMLNRYLNELYRLSMQLNGEMALDSIDREIARWCDAKPRHSVLYRGLAARVLSARRRTQRQMFEELF